MPPIRPSPRRRPPGRLWLLLVAAATLPSDLPGASAPADPRDSVVVFNEIHYQPAGDDTS
ncbi:MAG: hypothetical protein GWO24_31680, partial [Akkermansiaceae bacterium]|nr:hypothetical protein [Akkermansiaceae bacterium]